MTWRPSADGHGPNIAGRCGKPGPGSASGQNPASSSGKKGEARAADWLRDLGLLVIEHPGTAGFDSSGRGIEPDSGVCLGTGGTTRVMRGQLIDTFVEVKTQQVGGSVVDKIEYTIHRYAALCDQTGLAAVVVHDLDADQVGAGVVEHFARLSHAHLVGFVRLGALDAAGLRSLACELVRARAATLPGAEDLAEILASLGPHAVAALHRLALRAPAPASVDPYEALMN